MYNHREHQCQSSGVIKHIVKEIMDTGSDDLSIQDVVRIELWELYLGPKVTVKLLFLLKVKIYIMLKMGNRRKTAPGSLWKASKKAFGWEWDSHRDQIKGSIVLWEKTAKLISVLTGSNYPPGNSLLRNPRKILVTLSHSKLPNCVVSYSFIIFLHLI